MALFYLKEGSLHQAATFLSDQLKTFLEEGWDLLTAHTQMELAKCYLATGDTEKYIKTCVQLAACPVDSYMQTRIQAFEDVLKATDSIAEGKSLSICSERIFEAGWMKVTSTEKIILGSEVKVELVIFSKLPLPIRFDKIQVQLKHNPEKVKRHEKAPSLANLSRPKAGEVERKG
ncbi:UNVERIFIED_CONTAM: hypothetical protein GTU68_009204, partial [Idotea baltica]|nr:hypothetical protein [Idotea baltica]